MWMGFIPSVHQPTRQCNFPALTERKAQLQTAWQQATVSITHAQSLWRKAVNFHPYRKGDKVWLEGTNLHTSHPNHKLRPKRFGPFEVTAALGEVTYQLQLPSTWRIHNVFHTSLLSPYYETGVHGVNYSEPTLDLIDGEPEWEVEAILDSKRSGRKDELYYLIKWVGYSDANNSWEPAEHLRAPNLIKQFHRGHPRAARYIRTESSQPSDEETQSGKPTSVGVCSSASCHASLAPQVCAISLTLKEARPSSSTHLHPLTMSTPSRKVTPTQQMGPGSAAMMVLTSSTMPQTVGKLPVSLSPTSLTQERVLSKQRAKEMPQSSVTVQTSRLTTQGLLGSTSTPVVGIQDIKSNIKVGPSSARTSVTKFATVSPMK